MPRCVPLLALAVATATATFWGGALPRVPRGGAVDTPEATLGALEEIADVVGRDGAPDARGEEAHAALVAAWRARLAEGPRPAHAAQERFARELADAAGPGAGAGADGVNGTSADCRLLSAGACASLLGTARLAFERRRLAPHTRALPRTAAGVRLRCGGAPASVREALALAAAGAAGAAAVVVDEAALRRVRKAAVAAGHKRGLLTRERLFRSLFDACSGTGGDALVYVRDDACVFKSRGACSAVLDEMRDEDARTLVVFAGAESRADGRGDGRPRDAERAGAPLPSLRDVLSDEGTPSEDGGEPTFEATLRDLARRVAAEASRASENEDDARGRRRGSARNPAAGFGVPLGILQNSRSALKSNSFPRGFVGTGRFEGSP